MLVVLGFAMIGTFMFLIMSKRLTPIAALILVPVVFGLVAGGGLGLSEDVTKAISDVAPTAALLFFAIIFFGMMIDVGLFDPLIRGILRLVKNDPVKIVVGTALLTTIVSLDGDGSTTFIIVTSAFLPIYLRLGMSPVVLTCVAAIANGTLNTVPWGGSTARAAAALGVSPIDIFVPMIPAIGAGLVAVLVLAWLLGRSERKRLGLVGTDLVAPPQGPPSQLGSDDNDDRAPAPGAASARDRRDRGDRALEAGSMVSSAGESTSRRPGTPTSEMLLVDAEEVEAETLIRPDGTINRPNAKPRLLWVNLLLTLTVMTLLVQGSIEPAVIFFVAVGLGLLINFRRAGAQADQIKAHAGSIVGVVGLVFAATVLTGVLNGSGMVEAMADWLVGIIPSSMGPHFTLITALLSIPMTYFMSNDAFYFGVLPVLNETAANYGVSPVEMARASLVGQPLHQSSPIVASFLLLVGLARVELGDHQRKAIWRAVLVGLVMIVVGGLFGAFAL